MNISLLQVLNAPLFENVKILSGRAGLGRIVKRASVFDAPFKEDVLEKDILAPGDFFITSLLQFQPKSEELMQVLALLVKGNCSGLCVMMEERAELFSKEMLAFCEEKQFPVICMREDISYAEVLGVINQCILEEQTNVLNQLKLDKILASRTLPQERMKILLALIRGSGSTYRLFISGMNGGRSHKEKKQEKSVHLLIYLFRRITMISVF